MWRLRQSLVSSSITDKVVFECPLLTTTKKINLFRRTCVLDSMCCRWQNLLILFWEKSAPVPPTGLDTGYWVMSHLNHRPSCLPPPLPHLPSPYWSLCVSRHHSVWPLIASLVHFTLVLYISPQSCTFHSSLVHFTPWPICGGHL